MTEETKQSAAAKQLDNESKQQEKSSVEPKSLKESPEHFQHESLAKFAEKERENTQQREAVIRPQQAGKIDFKSLQNHSFNSNRTWLRGKDSPQSPSGKSRNRDRSRKSGKGERGNPQQLYRLSITNPRSNPTIGIAYPQQKVSSIKKQECSRGPVSGSYGFHVPSIPEREAELQEEELHFKCFQEDSPNLSSQSYTSQAVGLTSGGPAHQNSPLTPQQQKPSPIENSSTKPGDENVFLDFQLSETDTWQSPERFFRNANCGVTSQKPNNLVDLNKVNGGFMPLPFQYTYPLLEESASDSFQCSQNTKSQDYTNISLNPNQVSHNSFSFQSPAGGHEVMQAIIQFSNDQAENRQSHTSHAKPPQYMSTVHGVLPVPTNEASLVSSTGQSEQSKSVPDKFDSFNPADSQDTGLAVGGKRGCHYKNGTTSQSQRVIFQGSVHRIRNIAQGSSSQIHVIGSPHNGNHIGSGTLDKSVSKHHSRISHPWEGSHKAVPPPFIDHTSMPYPYQCQPSLEQRENTGINGRIPWQQIRFTTTMPNQNKIDLSRQSTNQQLTFLISPSDLQDDSKPHKNSSQRSSNNFFNKKTTEGFSIQGQDGGKQGCNTITPGHFTNKVESQISKILSPQFFYQQQDKALISSTNLNNSQNHYHSEASRGLHYKQETAKENILCFMPNNQHTKPNVDNGKRCLENYRTERNPPPPYSAHQLLTTSLATANLDQLDVLLTCKQCDQNFTNLVSFLDHKRYCAQHTLAQNDLKDVPKMEDIGKVKTDHPKAMSSRSSYAILQSSSDLHLSLLGLNKNGEIVADNETKGDVKDDPMKLMLPSAPLPDLEIEDPKLDSLITEALNGLGYQSDNAEIDSSFIDAFVDDELTTTKCTSTRQTLTTKDSTVFKGRANNELTPKALDKYPFDSDMNSLDSDSKHTKSTFEEHHESVQNEEDPQTDTSPTESQSQESSRQIEWETKRSEQNEQENDYTSKFLLSGAFSARCGLKSLQNSTALVKTTCPRATSVTKSPTTTKPIATEGKRKRSAGGSWSKELIHKIVQQKNKLHKLHVKGTKNMQFSLVMERVTPAVQTPTFQEYDYVSDSDEDCEPVKIASQGRLSQSIRCKYTYTKECKGRICAEKNQESSCKHKNECFEAKKVLDTSPSMIKDPSGHQRLRRRSSRSSTSSELSTTISICSDSSPKSVDHTDSDSDKTMEVLRKDQDHLEQKGYEKSPQTIESSTSLALTFMKNTKRYSTDKILLTEHKDSFTTSECSSIICKKEETASERTMTKSTVSLARFKTTRVEIEEKGDNYGFGTEILGTTEELFKKDYSKNITSPRGAAITLNPIESNNTKESNHVFKLKKDVVTSKSKSHKKRTNSSESPVATFEESNSDNPSREQAKRSPSDPFSNEPPTLCSSLIDEVCLSPSKIHDTSPQKDGQCLMPYTSDHDQSLIKSPLSFDTSSMFGDLSVGGFENNLYPDIHLAKESFSPSETTVEKKELFDSSFSPFLEQRDWNLMVDVTAELPEEISQYRDDSDSNESKTNFHDVTFSLPEKLMDYNSNLNSSGPVDDLEIKRIVTELESQLQTAKLSSPPPLDSELPKQLAMSKFSPLTFNPESEDENSSLEMNCASENLPTVTPVDSLFSEPDLPWTSPIHFGLMCRQQGLYTSTHSSAINTPTNSGHALLDLKDSTENHSSLHRTEKNKFLNLSTSKSEEMLEHEMYTENLMKSLEVISDSLSSGFTSPYSFPNQECEILEEHDKQESEHSDHSDDSEKVESKTTDTNTFSGKPEGSETSDTAGSKSDNGTKANFSQNSHVTLHNEELVGNEQQLAEDSFKSSQTKCFVDTSNETGSEKSVASIYEQNDHELSINKTEETKNDTKFDVQDSMHITQGLNFTKTKAENVMCVQDGHKYDGEESSVMLKPAKNNEHASDITGGTTDNHSNMDVHPPILNIKSACSEDHVSTRSQHSEICEMNSQLVASPKEPSVVRDDHDCSDSVQRAMPDSTLFPAQSEREENHQKNIEHSPRLVTVTQLQEFSCYSVQRHSDVRVNSTRQGGLNDFNPVTPELSKNRSATELDNSFIPQLDLVEVTESKMSNPGTLLAMDSISKQPLDETSKPSETLNGSQDKGTLYDLKLSPLNYSETCGNDYNCTSKCLNKGDDQSSIKSSSTESFITNVCALNIDKPLSCSPTHYANEHKPDFQSHMVGLDIPDISLDDNINHNDMKYSSIPASCCNFVDEVSPKDSSHFLTKRNQNNTNGSHDSPETVDYMNMHLGLLKKPDSEKLDNQMITNEHDALRSTTLDNQTKPKSSDLTCQTVQNEEQCLKPSETKNFPKKGGAQNAVQGKFQCEICAMCLRTLPGLKRHKAMKHVVISITENEPLIGQGKQVDTPLTSDGFTDDDVGISTISGNHHLDLATPENEKANINSTTKNNDMDISNEIFPSKLEKQDSFSDEILSILKTDILQAISPNFPLMEVKMSGEQKGKETVSTKRQDGESACTNHSVLYKKGAAYDDDVTTSCDTGVKHENSCSASGESPMLTGISGLGPDLKAFFEDESSFSQIFPRSDYRKRKKCARVYGKGNKKQKQLSCLDLDCSPTDVFIDKCEESKGNKLGQKFNNDHCEYETTSADDANLVKMCQKSSVQSSVENACHSNDDQMDYQAGCEENMESDIQEFLCETEDTIRQPIMHQDESQGGVLGNTMSSVSQQDCKPQLSTTTCPLQLVCVQDAHHSPSNRIQNPKTTIQFPVPVFEPGRDMPLVEPIVSTEIIDHVIPGQKPVNTKCGKRIEPGLKPKDKQYKCKVCFTWFLTLGELDFHKLSHNPSPPPTCYMCVQRKFSSREQLRDHLREKHAKNKAGVWTCGMCLKEISDVWMYNEHLREHATQFARRGQSQSSLLDMPGCFMQENAVKNFISSIMQHRPSRPAKGDNVKPPSKEERRSSLNVNGQEPKIKDEFDSTALKTKINIGGGGKHSALTMFEVLPKAETASKNAEMHPNCKDPSRDCHHCGKQFPKPFKLQRHLVVHSLQKVFLCHKCPVSYQEAKDLKDHLKNEHENTDEPDSKHTTLYTCELCADVMHVIKKSFICSTCNYTFSKKEQFDRHMEKHLAGGNKIFKFRGVVRPCKPFSSKDDQSDVPPSKKRKATDSNADNSNVGTVSLNLNKSTDIQGMKSVLPIKDDTLQKSTDKHSTETNTSVKIEDVTEDFLEVARDIAQCLVQTGFPEPILSTTELKEEDNNRSLSQECESREVSTADKEALTEICDVKVEDDSCAIPTTVVLENHINENHGKDTTEKNPPASLENATDQIGTQDSSPCTIPVCSQRNIILPNQDIEGLSLCNDLAVPFVKQSSCETIQLKQDQKIKEFSMTWNKNKQDVHTASRNEQPTIGLNKQISVGLSEDTLKGKARCHAPSSITSADSTRQQKKRKELKTPHSSQRAPSPTARENLGIEPRVRKKFRTNRCENVDGQRTTDLPNDYPVLTSVKEDTASNKIVYKNKTGSSALGFQLKKGSVDSFSPKKMEIVRHFTGDCKGKKSISGRSIHSPSFRMSTLNNSVNKSRLKPGVRTVETHSYRTAESQNNLLSQLFGQRLTSFKIPLRKDTSESVT